jgi:hypothetical protein
MNMSDGRDVIADLLTIAKDLESLADYSYEAKSCTYIALEIEDIADRIRGILSDVVV